MPLPYEDELELGMEADDKDDGPRPEPDDNAVSADPKEIEILHGILPMGHSTKLPSMPKSGGKWGSSQLDASASSESSGKDLDAKGMKSGRRDWCLPKQCSARTSRLRRTLKWCVSTIIRWTSTIQELQVQSHGASRPKNYQHQGPQHLYWYCEAGTVIEKSMFSVEAYREVLRLKGGDMTKFDKEVDAKFKKSAKGLWAPDNEKMCEDGTSSVCCLP